MKTFKMGGVHPEENKISSNCVIEQMPLPKQVAILMNQHLGAPATPIVAKGDKVKVGQLIAEAQAFMCQHPLTRKWHGEQNRRMQRHGGSSQNRHIY